MAHFFALTFEYVGLYAVSVFMLNLVWVAYKKSKEEQLPLPRVTWMLYTVKYSTGIFLGGMLGVHHMIWFFCALIMLLLITRQVKEVLFTLLVALLVYIYMPKQITPLISLYGLMWIVGASAFLFQKIVLIKKKTFKGLSFFSMTGFGMMHVCAFAFFLERGDILTSSAHLLYVFGHGILLYYMARNRNWLLLGVMYLLRPNILLSVRTHVFDTYMTCMYIESRTLYKYYDTL